MGQPKEIAIKNKTKLIILLTKVDLNSKDSLLRETRESSKKQIERTLKKE